MTAIGSERQAGGQGIVSACIVGSTGGLTIEAGTPHDRLGLSQAKPSQAKPSQAKPSQAKPSQAKPSQAKPSHLICVGASAMSAPAWGRSRPSAFPSESSASTRRLRLGLLSALLCLPLLAGLATPAVAQTPTANADGSYTVPQNWALKPSAIAAGTKFRLLFLTEARSATPTDIANYNSFVQNEAANGHAAIRPYKDQFRMVGSTATVDARDNTMTTGTGVPIYWLNGDRVADDYNDFWDGSWDAQMASDLRDENGNTVSGSRHWTGTQTGGSNGGTKHSTEYLGATNVRQGQWGMSTNPINQMAAPSGDIRRTLGLSPVFVVGAPLELVSVSRERLTVQENRQSTYTVVLKSAPSGNVVISARSGATATATVWPGAHVFSPSGANAWNIPKTFTVTGEGEGSTTISHAVQSSADTTNYPTSMTIPPVSVTVVTPQPRTEPISLIWTETIPPRPPSPPGQTGPSGREVAKQVKEGDGGTQDVSFYVRTERRHSSDLPFRVCVSGNATQSTTNSPQPEVEDDYQVVVDNDVVKNRCFDTSIMANRDYKRMTIRVLNDDRLEDRSRDTEHVILTLSQDPGSPLPSPYGIVSRESGYWKLSLGIIDDDFWQQPVQFSPAEYEIVHDKSVVPRSQTRRVKEGSNSGRVGLLFTKGPDYTPYTVTYKVVHDESTATYGDDYTLAGYNRSTDRGTILVPGPSVRQGGAALNVNVVDDKVQELEEKFVIEMVSVSGPLWVNKKDNRHKLSIAIDDNSPRSELNFDWLERTVQEGHGADTHDVRVSLRPEARGFGFRPQLPEDTHFEYCVESTATPGSDYEIANRHGTFVNRSGGTECWLATIPAGQTTLRLMTLRVLSDKDMHERTERVTVRLKPSTEEAKPTSDFMGIAPNRFAVDQPQQPHTFSTLTIKDDLPFVQVSLSGFDDGALLYEVRGTSGPPRGYPRIHWVVEDDSSGTIGSGSFSFRKGQTPSRTVRFKPPLYDASHNGYMIFRLTDGEYRLADPSHGTSCLPLGFSGSCPQLQTPGSSDDAVEVPDTPVANVQVTAVDAASATVTWDAVEHATSYRVEYESAGTLVYQGNYVQSASNGHTGTSWTFTHNAAEAMTLTVTVTPEVREDGNVQLFHDLAGTATIDVAPGSTDTQATARDACYAEVKPVIEGYAGETHYGTAHVTRWKQVLAAFGDDNGYAAMSLATAKQMRDQYSANRWNPVVEALQCLENVGPDTDPTEPEITVTGGSGVTEGGDAVFTVAADPAPTADLTVTLSVADDATSDFLAQSHEGARTVTLLAGQASATLTLATENDTTDEPDGRVSATVVNGTGYTVGSPNTSSVAVSDDDAPPVATPVVRLAGGSDITEGGTASFTLTATPAPTGTLAVRVDVTDSGSFAASGQTGTQTVTIGTTGTATLTVATTDDALNEADGRIAATIRTGTGYTVADPPDDTTAVTVADDDDPVVSLAAGNGVTEGTAAAFTLTATPAPHADLTVSLAVTQSGDYAAPGQTGTREVVIPTEGIVTVEIATVNDTTDEPNGSISATLATGSGYLVAASPDDTAAVAVADDDVAVAGVPTLSVNDVEVKEGPYRRIEFTVTLSKATREGASFYWRVRESTPVSAKRNSDFWASSQKKFAFIRPGETAYTVMAGLVIDDSHDEDPETFEIVLSDARGAALADAVGVATIVNSDPMPQAWLGRLGRTLAQQALDGITGRLTAPRTPGAQGTLAGQAFSLRPGGTETPTADPTTPAPSVLERLAALVLPGLTAGGAGGMGADPAFGGADPLFGGGLGDGDAGVPGVRGTGGLAPQTFTLRDALLGSSFTATGQPDAWGGSVALWGRAALATFDGQEDTFALDGEVITGLLGVDYARDRWLLGVSLLQSASTGGYLDRNTGATPCPAHDLSAEMRQLVCDGAVRAGDGKVEATLTAAVPYAAFQASERLNLWGAAGYGAGEVTLTPETGDALKTDLDWTMAQMGVRGTVLAPVTDDSGLAGGPTLAVTSDALWARTTSEKIQDGLAASESDVTRLRLGLEGSWLMALEDLGQMTPKLAVGARHDGGDAETGFGVELGGGLAWAMPTAGLALNVEGRTLLTHREEAFQDQGVAASFVFDPDPATPRGPSLTLRQDWGGQATGGVEALFAANPLAQRQSTTATRRWAADMAWGFPAWDGAFTSSPLVGLGLAPGSRDYRLGWRLVPATAASAFALEVQATRREPDAAIPEHRVGLELSTRW